MTDLDAIVAAGGPWARAERIGDCLLLQGDCREVMAVLPRVGAVVTDPPYGIGYVHSGIGGEKWHKAKKAPIIGDDQPFDPAPLLSLGEAIIWGADHFKEKLPKGGRFLAWNKLGNLPPMGDSFCNVEFAWHSKKGKAEIISATWKGLIKSGCVENGSATFHPSQKPLKVMEWCLGFLPDARTVLDPFAGSGTVAVACQRLGRQSISIELDADYWAIMCRRVQEAVDNPPLFIPEVKKPVQQGFEL